MDIVLLWIDNKNTNKKNILCGNIHFILSQNKLKCVLLTLVEIPIKIVYLIRENTQQMNDIRSRLRELRLSFVRGVACGLSQV